MTDMRVQFEPIGRSLKQYGPWHFADARFEEDHHIGLGPALLQTADIPGLSDRLLGISKGGRPDPGSARSEVTLSVSKVRHTPGSSPDPALPKGSNPAHPTEISQPLLPAIFHPSLAFTHPAPSGKVVVTFPLPEPARIPKPCLKRRRPVTDVDGPGTNATSRKKRRLLRQLITSRLSQPFSLPATHILNRESVAAGGKRFAKLTAIMSARRLTSAVVSPVSPQQPSPSTWLRRAAVLNSLRNRVHATAAERANIPVPDLAAKAAALQQSHGFATTFVGGRYLIATPIHQANKAMLPGHHGSTAGPAAGTLSLSSSAAAAAVAAAAATTQRSPPGAAAAYHHYHHHHHHHQTFHSNSHHPPPSTTRLRIPSPKLRPLRSPELRVTRPLVALEDIEPLLVDDPSSFSGDTDCVAFPTADFESRYIYGDDDDEEGGGEGVYADFSVIFGSGGKKSGDGEGGGDGATGGSGDGRDGDGDCFEDYMDDLDGIPWGDTW
ncbi:uncharacterized protein P884DRAFT_190283 [Thermothelomyces heterothallicus CBS 202.75]|uniref:uncharacterized protein n=1 Tax=Thermothelomyces heterothallicus CBS 202.75 TaxID=1149848 RepID=UPI003741E9C7